LWPISPDEQQLVYFFTARDYSSSMRLYNLHTHQETELETLPAFHGVFNEPLLWTEDNKHCVFLERKNLSEPTYYFVHHTIDGETEKVHLNINYSFVYDMNWGTTENIAHVAGVLNKGRHRELVISTIDLEQKTVDHVYTGILDPQEIFVVPFAGEIIYNL
jgi:hypothetical protein